MLISKPSQSKNVVRPSIFILSLSILIGMHDFGMFVKRYLLISLPCSMCLANMVGI